ncbi:MAG: hypothetical protein WD399_07290 [Thermoleophilaceae bacterium]
MSKAPTDPEIFGKLPPQGFGDAVDRVAFTAAPLLAGFAVTFVGFVATGSLPMRWPNATLLALVVAALLLIGSLQLAFNARVHYLPYGEFSQRLQLVRPDMREGVKMDYANDLEQYSRLVDRSRRAYNAGITVLLLAIAAALIPAGALSDVDALRWVAAGAATVGGLIELAWAVDAERQ